MAFNRRPQWIVDYIRIREEERRRNDRQRNEWRTNLSWNVYGVRRATGVSQDDLDTFMGQLQFILQEEIPEPNQDKIGRNIIDIDTKEFRNNGTAEDTFTITTQKRTEAQTKKTYRLMASKSRTFGGELGLNVGANFFNVGAVGLTAKGNASKTKGKEKTEEEEKTVKLSQDFGIEAELKAPPKTRLEVRITTYAVSYTTQVHVRAIIPSSAFLRVMAPKTGTLGCFKSKFDVIQAREFIKLYTGADDSEIQVLEEGSEQFYYVDYVPDLQYLGEITKIDKQSELPTED